VAYVRVSTDQQVESGLSLSSQQERLQAWATTQGDVELVDIVTDAGESARNLDRPGVARVLGMIDSRAVDVVLVVKLDRLTRSTRDLGDLLDRLQAADVALVSLTENLDTSTASGRMIVGMLGVVAQWEREIISERTRDALHVKRSRRERFTNVAPTGFRFVDGRMVQDDSETRMLNALREMGHDVGDDSMMSLRDMSRALAAAGYLSRTGKPLTAAQVSRLLNRMQRETVAA
jgi:site-specific DNA recombinase